MINCEALLDETHEPAILERLELVPDGSGNGQQEEITDIAAHGIRRNGQVALHGAKDAGEVLNHQIDELPLRRRNRIAGEIRTGIQNTRQFRVAGVALPKLSMALDQGEHVGDTPGLGVLVERYRGKGQAADDAGAAEDSEAPPTESAASPSD